MEKCQNLVISNNGKKVRIHFEKSCLITSKNICLRRFITTLNLVLAHFFWWVGRWEGRWMGSYKAFLRIAYNKKRAMDIIFYWFLGSADSAFGVTQNTKRLEKLAFFIAVSNP